MTDHPENGLSFRLRLSPIDITASPAADKQDRLERQQHANSYYEITKHSVVEGTGVGSVLCPLRTLAWRICTAELVELGRPTVPHEGATKMFLVSVSALLVLADDVPSFRDNRHAAETLGTTNQSRSLQQAW